jgi:hypothetical protein
MYFIQHCFTCRPSDSTVSEDAGIEPRNVRFKFFFADYSGTDSYTLIHIFKPIHTHIDGAAT